MFHLKSCWLSSGLFIIWVHSLIMLTCNDKKEAKHTFKFTIYKIMIMILHHYHYFIYVYWPTCCCHHIQNEQIFPEIHPVNEVKTFNMLSSSCLLLRTTQRISRWSHSLLFSSICWFHWHSALTGINNAELNWIDAVKCERSCIWFSSTHSEWALCCGQVLFSGSTPIYERSAWKSQTIMAVK